MDLVSGVVVYVLLWWWIFFMMLPVGAKRDDDVQMGNDRGAPKNPMLVRKLIATTLISAVVWVAVDQFIKSDLISFRDMIRDW